VIPQRFYDESLAQASYLVGCPAAGEPLVIDPARDVAPYLAAAAAAGLPRDRPIVTYCRSGARSAVAASQLRAAGLTDVANLRGGIDAWPASGLPIEDDAMATLPGAARR
jgi:rhodanese-related sulfurtransferase